MRWFVPSWNGDFRLVEGSKEDACELIVHKPTTLERKILGDFFAHARKKKWTNWDAEIPTSANDDKWTLVLEGPLAKVAPSLVKFITPKKQTITAVKFKDGHMEVVEGSDTRQVMANETAVETAVAKAGAEAAVTAKAPNRGCPDCVEAPRSPAAEVLETFLTNDQLRDWRKWGCFEAVGSHSKHTYLVSHRHSKFAAKWSRMVYDLTAKHPICVYDWTVPPEEETLAVKLFLEHRESMVSTYGAGPGRIPIIPIPRLGMPALAGVGVCAECGWVASDGHASTNAETCLSELDDRPPVLRPLVG